MLDLHNSERELLEIAQHFPGVLELLPNAADENGEEIRCPRPGSATAPPTANAGPFRRRLRSPSPENCGGRCSQAIP